MTSKEGHVRALVPKHPVGASGQAVQQAARAQEVHICKGGKEEEALDAGGEADQSKGTGAGLRQTQPPASWPRVLLACVQELGVDFVQGFLLARPADPPPEVSWPAGARASTAAARAKKSADPAEPAQRARRLPPPRKQR
jgi:hypothetical protein